MNVYDATRMADLLSREGYAETKSEEDADLVILNTCHIREKAAEKIYSELGKLAIAKRALNAQGRDMKIVVAGCVAQAEGEEVLKRQRAVDVVVGPQSYHRLPELWPGQDGARLIVPRFRRRGQISHLPLPVARILRARRLASSPFRRLRQVHLLCGPCPRAAPRLASCREIIARPCGSSTPACARSLIGQRERLLVRMETAGRQTCELRRLARIEGLASLHHRHPSTGAELIDAHRAIKPALCASAGSIGFGPF
jgi:tRNA-2-methylthio-N6-dimethylallyladenosine synthase